MIYEIDMQTGIFTLIIGHLICGILGVAHSMQDREEQMDYTFLYSRIINMIAWIILSLRDKIDRSDAILISSSLILIGMELQVASLLKIKFCYKKSVRRVYRLLLVLILIVNGILCITSSNKPNVILVNICISMFALWLYPLYVLLRTNTTVLQRFIGIVYGSGLLSFLLSIINSFNYSIKNSQEESVSQKLFLYSSILILMLVGNVGIILMSKEKTDIKVRYHANYDELTGIMNRRSFINSATEKLYFMTKKNRPIAFLLLDLDDFKGINDSYGHYAGDRVLVDFSQKVGSVIRDSDVFGRFGGEEFTILLTDIDYDNARKIAERIRHVISNSIVNNEISYTVSTGMVSLVPSESTTIEELYRFSDKALYRAKDKGKNCVELISEEECSEIIA